MNRKKILSIALTITFILSGLTIVSPVHSAANSYALDQQTRSLTSDLYPNSNYLMLWMQPNGSDPNFPPECNMFPILPSSLPGPVAQYWGSNTYFLFDPDSNFSWNPRESYTWAEIADRSLFPNGCHLIIGVTNPTRAAYVAHMSLTDSRVQAVWYNGDFSAFGTTPEALGDVYNATKAVAPGLKLYLDIYTVSGISGATGYWDRGPHNWPTNYLPYFDGVIFGPWVREVSFEEQHAVALYDCMMELHAMLPGKDIWMELMNFHFTKATFPWDYQVNTLQTAAQLYRAGIIKGVSMLGGFWDGWNPTQSNYMRDFINSEFGVDYQTTVDLTTKVATTTADGIAVNPAVVDVAELRANNYTFTSLHAQTIAFDGLTGFGVTIRNLRDGELYEQPGPTFAAAPGEQYQVYSWPHTTQWVNGNYAVTTPSTIQDKRLVVNGTIYVNASLTISRSLIQMGTDHYTDLIDNYSTTSPAWGIDVKHTGWGNYTLIVTNSTIEPLNRLFPYYFLGGSVDIGTRSWTIRNSTFAGWSDALAFNAADVLVCDSIFADPWGLVGTSQVTIGISGRSITDYWYRNLFYNMDATPASIGVWIDMSGYLGYDPSYQSFHDNTIVGAKQGFMAGSDYVTGTAILHNNVVYRGGFSAVADTHGVYAYPGNLTRDYPASWGYSPYVYHAAAGYASKTIDETTRFLLRTEVPITGTLRDAYGNAIGTYTSAAGQIAVSDIPLLQNVNGVVTWQYPYPWTFTITSALPAGYYYGIADIGSFGVNRSLRMDPWFVPFENNTFTVQAEEQLTLRIEQLPQQLYKGVPQYLAGSDLHMGDNLMGWKLGQYTTPQQVNISASGGTGTMVLNVTQWDPSTDSGTAVSWTASGIGTMEYNLSGLVAGRMYSITVNGAYVFMTITAGTNGTLSFSRTSTSADLQEFMITVSPVDSVMSILPMVIGIIIIVGVVSMVMGLVGTTGGRKK